MNKFILWDLDGTIVESEDIQFKTKMFKNASEKYGLTFDLRHEDFIGREAKHIFKDLLSKNDIKETDKKTYWAEYDNWYEDAVTFIKENVKDIMPRENIIELWNLASELGIKHAIVTSSREDVAKAYLTNIGLINYCELFTCINHVSLPKPNPEPYLLTMEKLKVSKQDCIAIEDSYSGIKSAVDSGLYTIAWVKDINNPSYSIANIKTETLNINKIVTALHV